MRILPKDATLLIVDIQQGFDDPAHSARNNPRAEEKAATMLTAWRHGGRPALSSAASKELVSHATACPWSRST